MRCGNFLVKEFVGDDAHELNLGMIVEIVLELVDYVVFDIAILDRLVEHVRDVRLESFELT